MKDLHIKAPVLWTKEVSTMSAIPSQNDFPTTGPLIGGELSDHLKGIIYLPTQFRIEFRESGEVALLHRVDLLSLQAGGDGHIFYKDESLGSIELINGELIINDEEDEALLYVKDILSDIVY